MELHIIENVTKEYPEMIQVVIYKTPRTFVTGDRKVKRNREIVDDVDYKTSITTLRRTKTLIKDMVLCNDFELFCTFTFDPNKVDRFNLTRCWGVMSRWLHHQRDLSPDMKYLIIPEMHKSGAWHFHGLISGYKSTLKPSSHSSPYGRQIFNITSFRSGFTTAVKIDDKEAVSNYVQKYITKDFVKKFNQRRFFCSRNLIRPIKSTNSPIFRNTSPLFKKKISDFGDSELYYIPNF